MKDIKRYLDRRPGSDPLSGLRGQGRGHNQTFSECIQLNTNIIPGPPLPVSQVFGRCLGFISLVHE